MLKQQIIWPFLREKGGGNVDMAATVKKAQVAFKNMGYNSYYSTDGTDYNVLKGTFKNGTKRLESDIVFLTGHGDWNNVQTTSSSGLYIGNDIGTYYVGVNSFDWSKVKLAIFLACNTGIESSNKEINLAYNVFMKSGWKTTTFGWHQTITTVSADKWMDYYTSKLQSGATVEAAMNYANSQKYSDDRVKDIAFYGNGSLKMSANSTMASIEPLNIDESNITYVSDSIHFDGKDLSEIINLLTKYNPNFNIDCFDVNIYTISKEHKYYTIEFTYKIGDIYTNSAYTVIVNDGKVVQFADNSVVPNKDNVDIDFSKSNDDIAKSNATINLKRDNINECISNNTNIIPITIRNQETRKYIDLNTGRKYIKVFTTYGYEGSESTIAKEYDYELK